MINFNRSPLTIISPCSIFDGLDSFLSFQQVAVILNCSLFENEDDKGYVLDTDHPFGHGGIADRLSFIANFTNPWESLLRSQFNIPAGGNALESLLRSQMDSLMGGKAWVLLLQCHMNCWGRGTSTKHPRTKNKGEGGFPARRLKAKVDWREDSFIICEQRLSMSIQLRCENPKFTYDIVVLADGAVMHPPEKAVWKFYKINPCGNLTGLSQFLTIATSLSWYWKNTWNSCLNAIDDAVRFQVRMKDLKDNKYISC